jgi:iron(II)-dependent oxidoreductase
MNNHHATIGNLTAALLDVRSRTLALVEGLNEQQLLGPILPTVNPLRWEIAHAAYFHELWVLRHLGQQQAIRSDVDALFDSISIQHEDRWQLPLPSLSETFEYMNNVLQAELLQLKSIELNDTAKYYYLLALFHEDMHNEAFTYTRQTLGYSKPIYIQGNEKRELSFSHAQIDIKIPGGKFLLGAERNGEFIFDNEKWAHEIIVTPFKIAKYAVSNEDYLEFVEAGGYQNKKFWDHISWQWRCENELEHPIYWKKDADRRWTARQFDQWGILEPTHAVMHISWYEAQAFCSWANRRLPTEAEWEFAAAGDPSDHACGAVQKRVFPWGNELRNDHANLDSVNLGTVAVDAYPQGDSAFGCRQMIGNVWEWTASTFLPYPGFSPDGYAEYSRPLFGQTKVVRGGAWTTRGRMLRNTWRNYYGPDRNDVFAGFRTCAK